MRYPIKLNDNMAINGFCQVNSANFYLKLFIIHKIMDLLLVGQVYCDIIITSPCNTLIDIYFSKLDVFYTVDKSSVGQQIRNLRNKIIQIV